MNKTVNINLANSFFHIDEVAYSSLRRYLESVKRSFKGTSGSDEIIADIEARIAELFRSKMESDVQVVTQKEVDEVITIMGQPEDYMVDEDIFEDEPQQKRKASSEKGSVKKLYRDMQHKYIGGVCSGLEHYLGFDSLWIRIIFLILAFGTGFGFIAYILLWILVPEANTTSQKIDMSGKPINISNIERKVKEGFDDVTSTVKNADYEKMGSQIKSSSKSFFDTIADIFMMLFKVFGKFIGIMLIIIGAATLIGLFVGLLTVGTLDWAHIPFFDNFIVNATNTPIWLVSLLGFFVIGIPFFFLLYLGLKILIDNLKSIGNIAKYSLLGLWLLSIATLIVLGVREAASHAYFGSVTQKEQLFVASQDSIKLSIASSDLWDARGNLRMNDMIMTFDDDGVKTLISDDVRFRIKKSNDSVVRIEIRKEANGSSASNARESAQKIDYSYEVSGNTIILNNYLTAKNKSRFSDQEVKLNILIPEGTILSFNETQNRNWNTNNDKNINRSDVDKYIWKMGADGELKCQDCPEELDEEWNDNNGNTKVIINEDGINININEDGEKGKISIGENGIDINLQDDNDSFELKIDEDGIRINSDED